MAVINGTSQPDVLTGTAQADTIHGFGGADRIDGGAGNDHIEGGALQDIILGGSGNDFIWGGAARDALYGGTGADTFYFEFNAATGEVYGPGGLGMDVIQDFHPFSEGDSLLIRGFGSVHYDPVESTIENAHDTDIVRLSNFNQNQPLQFEHLANGDWFIHA